MKLPLFITSFATGENVYGIGGDTSVLQVYEILITSYVGAERLQGNLPQIQPQNY